MYEYNTTPYLYMSEPCQSYSRCAHWMSRGYYLIYSYKYCMYCTVQYCISGTLPYQ